MSCRDQLRDAAMEWVEPRRFLTSLCPDLRDAALPVAAREHERTDRLHNLRRRLHCNHIVYRILTSEVVMRKAFIVLVLLGSLLSAPAEIALVGSAQAQARPSPNTPAWEAM